MLVLVEKSFCFVLCIDLRVQISLSNNKWLRNSCDCFSISIFSLTKQNHSKLYWNFLPKKTVKTTAIYSCGVNDVTRGTLGPFCCYNSADNITKNWVQTNLVEKVPTELYHQHWLRLHAEFLTFSRTSQFVPIYMQMRNSNKWRACFPLSQARGQVVSLQWINFRVNVSAP